MTKKRINKILSIFLAVFLLVNMAQPIVLAAPGGTITVVTVEDLKELAKNCSLDTWSQGKTVRLTSDIDLTGIAFTPIPTFGGTFLGGGHTISGMNLTTDGSNIGFFRFVQEGAIIHDLTVTGQVAPGGTRTNVGGIAGNSEGSIINCTFRGSVKGKRSVGGIAGTNGLYGEITGCSAQGSVIGENSTGGIAGQNSGVLLNCTNNASINTSEPTPSTALENLNVEGALNQFTAPANEEEDRLLNTHSDTGGIVGYSSGMIQSCINNGKVGYNHVGYNIGGIAGRQTGYMDNCSNTGTIYGRKDVGGIVGQAEPDVAINTDGNSLSQLRQELGTLNNMVDQAIRHTEASQDDISAQLSNMNVTIDGARDSAKVLLDHTSDFVDSNLDALNTLNAAATAALDELVPAFDSLAEASRNLSGLCLDLEEALDILWESGRLGRSALATAKDAVKELREASSAIEDSISQIQKALDSLRKAVIIHDQEAVSKALRDLSDAIHTLGSAIGRAGDALGTLQGALQGSVPGDEGVIEALGEMIRSLADASSALSTIGSSIGILSENIEINWSDVLNALDSSRAALDSLAESTKHFTYALDGLRETLSAAGLFVDSLGDANGYLASAASYGYDIGLSLEDAFDAMREAASRMETDGSVTFTPLGQPVRDAGNNLYTSLSDLSDNMESLLSATDKATDTLSMDLQAINRQLNRVFTLMIDVLDNVQATPELTDLFGDVSDENIEATRLGKVSACSNEGHVEGDRNIGGVVGSMAIEYALDPEDDNTHFNFGNTYEIKAVLQNCINHGEITGRRDCIGGLAGRMDLGTIIDCQNYGSVSGSSGYVGGIAGYADATVRDSWAKCTLSGNEYVGGIAGWANHLSDCRSIVTITDATEYLGSIAGNADMELGVLEGNLFMDMGIAGIDGVSYAGIAEPVSYDALRTLEDSPDEFLSFTLMLTADGKTIENIPFRYGEDLSQFTLPDIPESEGYYGTWPDFDFSGTDSDIKLEAVYTPLVTLAASEQQDGKLSLALAEGSFTEDVILSVLDSDVTPPSGSQIGKNCDVWEVTLIGTELTKADTVPLRLLNRHGTHADVLCLSDNRWEPVETSENGRYLLLTMNGTSAVFCVRSTSGVTPAMLIIGIAAAGLVAILIVFGQKRKQKSRTKQQES